MATSILVSSFPHDQATYAGSLWTIFNDLQFFKALLSLSSLETVPENDGMGDTYIHGELCLKDSMPCSVLEVH